jgi:starch synthase
MRILFAASEAVPYAKSGGLADVLGSLPQALARRGHEVLTLIPRYGFVRREGLRPLSRPMYVPTGTGPRYAALLEDPRADHPTFLVEYDQYFDRPYPYGPPGQGYGDNCERFAFFSSAVLSACRTLGFLPDVIHVHDWHTALVPVLVNLHEWGTPLYRAATVLTVHNIGYQGVFGKEQLVHTRVGWEHFHQHGLEMNDALNLLKGGLYHATRITTVSPTHAWEIQTREGGFGLDGVIRERRGVLSGILNGLDVDAWNPATDPHLAATYDADSLDRKALCKADLQRRLGLPVRPEVPVIGMVTRLTSQKGTDVVAAALGRLLQMDLQLVVLGSGDADQEAALRYWAARAPQKLVGYLGLSEPLAHRIEAGADLFLMPSRYEPCGLNQMYSQRYGTPPIVRATGGLADTVESFDEHTGAGTGFVFQDLHPGALFDVVGWAVWAYYQRQEQFRGLMRQGMQKDFSWDLAAARYEAVYHQAVVDRTQA